MGLNGCVYLRILIIERLILMESALEVLSRAATMVNTNGDNRITINKELPTTKWRRDRRIRLSSEYHHSNHSHETIVGTVKPLGESNSLSDNSMEIPLDMSVGSSKPPPPPYRDPLPGSTFSTTMSRPSVITQAPKREVISNQENKQSPKKLIALSDDTPVTESISMVDPVIDEHFRRSLGADYMNLFGKRLDQLKSTSSATDTIRKSPQVSPVQSVQQSDSMTIKETIQRDESSSLTRDNVKETVENIEMSVDDHFAKALGETWKQLQQNNKSTTPSTEFDDKSDVSSDPDNDSNAKGDGNDNDDDDEITRSSKTPNVINDDSSESQGHR